MSTKIIGAGPAGLYLAQKLKELSIDFEIFEEHSEIGKPVQCAGLVSKNLDSLLEVPKRCVLNEVKGAKLYSPSGKVLELVRGKNEAYVLDREIFDKYLAENLDVNLGERIESIGNGECLIGADGPNSIIAELAGFPKFEEVLFGLQYVIPNENFDKNFVELYFSNKICPDFFAWIIPTDKNLRIGLAALNSPEKYLDSFLEEKFGKVEIIEKNAGLLPVKWRSAFVKDNVALVGDSAGHVKPATGGGIYIGLKSAEILADAIAQNNLLSYEQNWNEQILPELEKSARIRNLILKVPDEERDNIWEILNKSEVKSILLEHGDMDKPGELMKNMLKNGTALKLLPYLRYLF